MKKHFLLSLCCLMMASTLATAKDVSDESTWNMEKATPKAWWYGPTYWDLDRQTYDPIDVSW